MRRYLFGAAASLLALLGLAGSPSPARADHRDWNHRPHQHWHHGYPDRGYGWNGYSTPYRPRFFVQPYGYSYPYYGPYYDYVYPGYGLGYQGPNFSFWIGQ
jgi:hypothetical protein